MHTSRRFVALGATMALALGTLAGCGGGSTDDGGTTDGGGTDQGAMADFAVGTSFKATEPIEVSLMYRDHTAYPFKDDWLIVKSFQENQNVTFDYTNVPIADWDSQKAIIIGGGDAPDLIPVTYTTEQSKYAGGGAILPISDYLDEMPNFQDKISKWDLTEDLEALRQADGKFYVLPGLHEKVRVQYSVAIRKDYWDQAGVTEDPKTWDEFKAALQKIKDANIPGLTYPMSDRWKMGSLLSQAGPGFYTIGGTTSTNTWGYGAGVFWNGEEFEYAGANDGQKQMLAYFADLIASGLMDPESITQDDTAATAKFTTGQSAAISSNDQVTQTDLRTTMEAEGTPAEIKLIRVPGGPAGDYLAGNRFESGLMVSAAAADKPYFTALLQFIDWLYYSDEGLEFSKWGVLCEGGAETDCTYTDTDGTRAFLPSITYNGINQEGDGSSQKKLNVDFGFSNGEWMLANGSTAELEASMATEDGKQFSEAMADKELLPVAPGAPLTEDQSADAATLQVQLQAIMIEDTVAYLQGAESVEEDWDAHVERLKSAGMDTLVQYWNDARAQ
ncbi:MAG: extracellular solute-binding protein [Propionibacteriaceae bacterium]|jgi:putative aldouronate transport system substrate-binding protein|nr:extracellular solute-binding protein [Propionibacteriaceae bacterium]